MYYIHHVIICIALTQYILSLNVTLIVNTPQHALLNS